MSMQIFDASGIKPQQGFDQHPPGMFDFRISNTYGKPTKDGTGGMFVVEFTTPAGRIESRYNLWNQSQQAVDIAQKELSALCHAVGIFKLSFDQNNLPMAGAELRGAMGRVEIAPQKNNPDYMEVKKVFDVNGNEPGKAPQAAPTPAQQSGAASWGQQAQSQTPSNAPQAQPQSAQAQTWGAPQQQQQTAPPQQAWGPGGNAASNTPPWGQKG